MTPDLNHVRVAVVALVGASLLQVLRDLDFGIGSQVDTSKLGPGLPLSLSRG